MSGSQGFVEDRRALLRVEGPEARDWLQGLVSNDVTRLAPGRAVYAAMLSPQGKYLFDFVLVADGDAVLLDAPADRMAALRQKLALYKLRRKVTLADEPRGAALIWGGDAPQAPDGALIVPDPRDPALGWRLYATDPGAALAALGAAPVDRAAHDALRVACAVPESGVELIPDDTYILEAVFERLNGVDFRKGCYVGQEVTARMRHKTTLRKGLVRVAVEGEAPPPGAPLVTEDGKEAGTLHTVVGGAGLANLRFDRANGPLTAGRAIVRASDIGAERD